MPFKRQSHHTYHAEPRRQFDRVGPESVARRDFQHCLKRDAAREACRTCGEPAKRRAGHPRRQVASVWRATNVDPAAELVPWKGSEAAGHREAQIGAALAEGHKPRTNHVKFRDVRQNRARVVRWRGPSAYRNAVSGESQALGDVHDHLAICSELRIVLPNETRYEY